LILFRIFHIILPEKSVKIVFSLPPERRICL
jgi:hypothetical protein